MPNKTIEEGDYFVCPNPNCSFKGKRLVIKEYEIGAAGGTAAGCLAGLATIPIMVFAGLFLLIIPLPPIQIVGLVFILLSPLAPILGPALGYTKAKEPKKIKAICPKCLLEIR
ncbi:MAG: hypothetical protein KatS3mg087_1168 [Patescibacteria group bacterium]|nr:MAG: hypothetical protein KatS3mg087_1168 [Patescibacteria group bacterium]